MKKALPIILLGVIVITLLDVLGSIASRKMDFNYSYLSPISFVIYVAIAFVIANRTDKKTAIISAGVLGLFDSTVGLKLSMILQANTGDMKVEFTPVLFIVTAIFVTLLASLFGLIGSWLATKFEKNK